MSRISFLIRTIGGMTEMLTDMTVTNQSHCKSGVTVKDISGPSSYSLVRRCRPVTVNSHTVSITQDSSLLWLFSIPAHHNLAFSLFLSVTFVIVSSCSILLVGAWQKDADCADGSGQVAVCYKGFCGDDWATLACCSHRSPKIHTSTPNRTIPANMLFSIFAFSSVSLLLFSSSFADHLDF